jgi:RNA polymerase-binding transcription factor DksA
MGFIAQALSRHKEKVAPEQHPDFDGENCLECGNEIPMVRLEMGKIRCVHCQEALELRNKMFGKK